MITAQALSAREIANRLFEHIVDPLIALMAFIALVLLIVMGIKFITTDASEDRGEMLKKLGWTIFGIFIIFSIFTIVSFVERLSEPGTRVDEGKVEFRQYELLERRDANITPNR